VCTFAGDEYVDSLSTGLNAEVLDRLFQKAEATDEALSRAFQNQDHEFSAARINSFLETEKDYRQVYRNLAANYLNFSLEFGRFLYLCTHARNAKRIVELGSSFGILTIHPACALRDGGELIETELEPSKAATAAQNVAAAGLEDLVYIRVGYTLETLTTEPTVTSTSFTSMGRFISICRTSSCWSPD
jgi:predicted O-methyltransferase YrrM